MRKAKIEQENKIYFFYVFLLEEPKTDLELYNWLYTFDEKKELE